MYQFDIEQAFIADEADFDAYVRPAQGCKVEIGSNGKPKIWRVLKNWYGNKQGPRVFATNFKDWICSEEGGGWKQSETAPCLFTWKGRSVHWWLLRVLERLSACF